MKRIHVVSPFVLALGALLSAGSALGFSLLSPPRTWDCPPNYTVDETGIASIADGDGGATKVVNAINSTSDGWNSAGAARIVSAHKGSVASFTLGDGVPMIKFGDPLGSCTAPCLALTFISFFSERNAGSASFRIKDADVVTNLGFTWTSEGEDPGGVGCSGEHFIEGVMVHEVGHGLGLDHSNISGATMRGGVFSCSNTGATIETDDANGILTLYGVAPCTNSTLFPCNDYTQNLPTSGSFDAQPCGAFFSMGGSGTIKGWVEGPENADYDLFLDRLGPLGIWFQVASATSVSSSESITFSATAGIFRFRVVSFSGHGTYHFWYQRLIL